MTKTEFDAKFNSAYKKAIASIDFRASLENDLKQFSNVSEISTVDLVNACIKASCQANQMLLKTLLQDLLTDGE